MAKRRHTPPPPSELDPTIHERLRLGMVCALTVHDSLTFTELRDMLQTTDGNLSVQARRLEDAGYIAGLKNFQGRKPKTSYKLTARGRAALQDYINTLSEMLPAASQRAGEAGRVAWRPLPAGS